MIPSWSAPTTLAPAARSTSYEAAASEELAKLTASDAAVGDRFGSSVAIAGGTIVVGAYQDDDGASNSGSVYVFEKSTWGTYDQVAKLTAADAAAGTPSASPWPSTATPS